MPASATEGTILAKLVTLAKPLCRAAERVCPRRGPGVPPDYPDWKVAILIMVAVAARRKSKSAQYRYLKERRHWLMAVLDLPRFPARSTYFERYRRLGGLWEEAVRLQGALAIQEGWVDATAAAVDKSLLPARGPGWAPAARRAGRRPRGVDADAAWGYSEHHGWVYGYSYEVVVSASAGSAVFPLLVSVQGANGSEHRTFRNKIGHLPHTTRYVLADGGYDNNAHGEAIEYDARGHVSGRRFLCPLQARGGTPRVGRYPHRGRRERSRRRRARRWAFFCSRRGQRLYRRRATSVEPFNEWFKTKFELHHCVWHRGLVNIRTQVASAIFLYQLLLRYHRRQGGNHATIQWILDAL